MQALQILSYRDTSSQKDRYNPLKTVEQHH